MSVCASAVAQCRHVRAATYQICHYADLFWHCGSLLLFRWSCIQLSVCLMTQGMMNFWKGYRINIQSAACSSHTRLKSKYVQMLNRSWIKSIQLPRRDTDTFIEALKSRGASEQGITITDTAVRLTPWDTVVVFFPPHGSSVR